MEKVRSTIKYLSLIILLTSLANESIGQLAGLETAPPSDLSKTEVEIYQLYFSSRDLRTTNHIIQAATKAYEKYEDIQDHSKGTFPIVYEMLYRANVAMKQDSIERANPGMLDTELAELNAKFIPERLIDGNRPKAKKAKDFLFVSGEGSQLFFRRSDGFLGIWNGPGLEVVGLGEHMDLTALAGVISMNETQRLIGIGASGYLKTFDLSAPVLGEPSRAQSHAGSILDFTWGQQNELLTSGSDWNLVKHAGYESESVFETKKGSKAIAYWKGEETIYGIRGMNELIKINLEGSSETSLVVLSPEVHLADIVAVQSLDQLILGIDNPSQGIAHLQVYDLASGELLPAKYAFSSDPILSLRMSSAEEWVVINHIRRGIRLFDPISKNVLKVPVEPDMMGPGQVLMNDHDQHLYFGSVDGSIRRVSLNIDVLAANLGKARHLTP